MICHPSNFQIRQEGEGGGVQQSLNAKNKMISVFFPMRTSCNGEINFAPCEIDRCVRTACTNRQIPHKGT